jgi:ATP synthase protein I
MGSSKNQQNQKKKSFDNFAKYSGLTFEMFIPIGAGVFGGIKLDEVFNSKPLFTAVLSLSGVIMAIYFALKDVLHNPKNEKENP